MTGRLDYSRVDGAEYGSLAPVDIDGVASPIGAEWQSFSSQDFVSHVLERSQMDPDQSFVAITILNKSATATIYFVAYEVTPGNEPNLNHTIQIPAGQAVIPEIFQCNKRGPITTFSMRASEEGPDFQVLATVA